MKMQTQNQTYGKAHLRPQLAQVYCMEFKMALLLGEKKESNNLFTYLSWLQKKKKKKQKKTPQYFVMQCVTLEVITHQD